MTTKQSQIWFRSLFAGLLIATLGLAGCDGDDGDDGADGTSSNITSTTLAAGDPNCPNGGVQYDTFTDGVLTSTDYVCNGGGGGTSLTAQEIFDLGLADAVVAINPVLDLSNTVDYDPATGTVTAHFFLTDGNGNGVDVFSSAYEFRFYVSELRNNTDGTIGQSWNRLIQERGTPAAEDPADRLPGTLTLLDAVTGEYNYVFVNTLPASTNVYRVTARARWRENVFDSEGTRFRIVFANPVNASYDFLQADPGTELASSGADMVTTESCNACHGNRIGNVGHGGGYTEYKTCVHCHNSEYMAGNNGEGDLAFMVHRIHAAGQFQELDNPTWRAEVLEITYPQEIYTCDTCHTADAPNADLSALVPTAANCGSCHEGVNFETGEGHAAGAATDDTCSLCHREGVVLVGIDLSPSVVHDPDPLPENVPEYEVTIAMTPPANGTHYVAGEEPEVTVTLAGANPVNYTADPGAEGDGPDGVLSEAELYIYGPRANAVPVLATDTVNDTVGYEAPPTQGHDVLLTGGVSTDPLVRTDANGYKYQLLPIPADFPAGTYMVRFEGLDYGTPGAPSVPEYWTASTAVMTFQVGQADEEPKLSGDACTDCHGDTIMHLAGAHPHHAPFETDGCLACHDLSDNYGQYIGNRAHAVHSASATGDLSNDRGTGLPRDWTEVTYPRPANNCRTCHTNSETDVPVWRDPNEVACGGCHGADPDADSADYPDVEDIINEIAAAQHMLQNGGTFDPATTNPYDPSYVVRQCIVCHGEGRIADVFESHGLVNFPVTDDLEE